jgi:hypothetical protein
MTSKLVGEGGFELRGVVKLLVFLLSENYYFCCTELAQRKDFYLFFLSRIKKLVKLSYDGSAA